MQLVYIGGPDRRVFIRRFDELEPRALTGAGMSNPRFSPDGQQVAFNSNRSLMKMPVDGGSATKIADYVAVYTWGSTGTIVYGADPQPRLFRVSDGGGTAEVFTPPPRPSEWAYGTPSFLPDGDALVFTIVMNGRRSTEIAAIRLSDRKIIRLGIDGVNPIYVPSIGQLLTVGLDRAVRLTPFDAQRLRITGPSVVVLQDVMPKSITVVELALSTSGTLVYVPGQPQQLVELDRVGHARAITPMSRDFSFPRYSPDGRRIAVAIGQLPSTDVWIYDTASTTLAKMSDDGHSTTPVWSPDGRRVAWTSTAAGGATWWRPWDKSEDATLLVRKSDGVTFSPTGDYMITNMGDPSVANTVRLDSLRASKALMKMGMPSSRISPDGHWLAYVSSETGVSQVYVRPLPGPGGQTLVSNRGGFEPVWNPKGGELFYRDGAFLSVATLTTAGELRVTHRDTLFALNTLYGGSDAQYDVSPDGKHIVVPLSIAGDSPPVLITGWIDELRRRAKPPAKP
jgi:serine/threonine-protein kinase